MAVGTTERKAPARGRIRMPVKRSINLAATTEKPINKKIAIPAIILIIIAAVLLGKFAVADRLAAAARASGRVAALQAQLDEAYAKLDGYNDVADLYAHYTLSGMTQEELSRADRVAVADMLRDTVMKRVELTSWELKGNELTLGFNARDLETVNALARTLEQDDLVSFCSVDSATTAEAAGDEEQSVTASVVVYLNSAAEGVNE